MQHRLVFDKKVLNIVDDCEILFGLLVCMSLSRKIFFFSRRDRGSRSRRVNRRRWWWPTTARHRAAGRYRLPHLPSGSLGCLVAVTDETSRPKHWKRWENCRAAYCYLLRNGEELRGCVRQSAVRKGPGLGLIVGGPTFRP